MKAWAVTAPLKPLEELDFPSPQPKSTEVIINVTHCGVCHSDLHFWKGEYNLGGGKVLKLADRGVVLPRAPGHEIAGEVVAYGAEAEGVQIGDRRVVYPWVGCGSCAACRAEQDNLCTNQRSLGVVEHGGFASQVTVPHPRYLVDPGHLDLGLAATYACSGITAYSAVRRLLPCPPDQPIVLIGAGGLGLAAIAMLRSFGHRNIVSIDRDHHKENAALAAGASIFVDGSQDLAPRILDIAGGHVMGVIDFVNISATAQLAMRILGKNGKLILVGVGGGELTLSLAEMVMKAHSVISNLTGSIQDLRDVISLANEGKIAPTPITRMRKCCATEALVALRDGTVTGRLVLTDE